MRTKLQTYLVLSIPVFVIVGYLFFFIGDTLARVSDVV